MSGRVADRSGTMTTRRKVLGLLIVLVLVIAAVVTVIVVHEVTQCGSEQRWVFGVGCWPRAGASG